MKFFWRRVRFSNLSTFPEEETPFQYYPEGKGHTHTIETIREIKQLATQPPKHIIIHDAHCMQIPAQNALLKTLEEPEPGVQLTLITSHPELLLPTVRSRLIEIPTIEEPLQPDLVTALALIQGDSPDLSETDPDALLLAIFSYYRDLHLLHVGGDTALLTFPEHPVKSHTSLEKISNAITKAREALSCHVSLDRALETFFLSI